MERTLECARQIAGFSFAELWVRYFAYGGMLNARALEDALCGGGHIGTRDYDVLSVVFNEEFRLDGLGEPFSATS